MSIRRRLLLWLLSSVLAGGLAAASVVFFQARAEVDEIFDYQLRQLALTLRDRTYLTQQLGEALQGEEAYDVVIQVWGPDGTLLYASRRETIVPGPVRLGFGEADTRDGRWRVFAIQQRGLTIQVAQPTSVREQLAFAAAWRTLIPFLVALPLMGLLIWRLVGRELRTLETTAVAVAKRTPESLEPISTRSVPQEIQPLVAALNDLLSRLSGALSQQRRFIADAAHELRTPLTALILQLQLAERATDPAEHEKALATLREGIARAVRLVEQLLALARQDPEAPIRSPAPVDLAELAKSAADFHAAAADAHGLTLRAEAAAPVVVQGEREALRTLIDNLVDNAIRYTPQGTVTIRAAHEGATALLEVIDTGPGVPAAERERVFDRFYRGERAAATGSGLGLAIVRAIADRHGARVELLDSQPGTGLRVRVVFPALSPS